MSPDEYAASRAERDREAARDAIAAGCATPDEWALVTGQVDVLRGGVFAEAARAAHRVDDRWSMLPAATPCARDPFSAEDYALLASWLGGQR